MFITTMVIINPLNESFVTVLPCEILNAVLVMLAAVLIKFVTVSFWRYLC